MLKKLSLCYRIVYYYYGTQKYDQSGTSRSIQSIYIPSVTTSLAPCSQAD